MRLLADESLEDLGQGVLGVQLEGPPPRGRRGARGLEDPLEVGARIGLARDEAHRRVGQAVGHPHARHALSEHALDRVDQAPEHLVALLGLGLVLVVERQLALGRRDELLALELGQRHHDPLVDGVGEEQHLVALGLEALDVGAVLEEVRVGAGDEVDRLLTLLHARDVLAEAGLGVLSAALEAEQARDPILVGEVAVDPLLDHAPEVAPEREVVLGLALGQLLDHGEDLLDDLLLDLADEAVLLEHLARDVEREVVAVDHAPDEAQVLGEERVAVVHHEHALDVELDPARGVAHVEVEGGTLGEEQEPRELLAALDGEVRARQRRLPVVADVLVELLVLLVGDVLLGASPERLGRVDRLAGGGRLGLVALALGLDPLELDRVSQEVRVALDQVAQPVAVGVLVLVLLEVQHDARPALGPLAGLERELALGLAAPGPGLVALGGAARDLDLVRDEEGRVEPDPELPDQVGALGRLAAEGLGELLRARLGDGPQVREQLVLAHPDPVVRDRDRPGLGIGRDLDVEVLVGAEQVVIGQAPDPGLVQGVGRVADQLAQEDLLLGVEGVNDQVEELTGLGLKGVALEGCAVCHLDGLRRWGLT